MSRKIRVGPNDPFVNPQYATWLSQAIEFIQPQNLYIIGGRATAKTSELIAERSMDVMYDMPHSQQVFVSDTYVNCLRNIMPTLFEGWERKGWKHGRDYITDRRPPAHFKNCYKPTDSFKHTVSIKTGVRLILGSLDQPSGLAGNSFQHIYGDEARLLKFKMLKKLNPAIRGEHAQFGHSVFYRGRTFTTDMPNILDGDDDWITLQEKEMDLEQVKVALQVGVILNEIRCELYNATIDRDPRKVALIKRNLERWTERWVRVRKNLTFYYAVSSFVNADILQEGFFRDTFKSLGIEEFKSAILSLKVNITKGEKFYSHLTPEHFYNDGVISEYYDRFLLTDEIEESSRALRYLNHHQPLDAGVDFGDQLSMITAQQSGNTLRILKEFYTLPPQSTRELAEKFRNFYKTHERKELNLYYDRSGNQYAKIKRDWAHDMKNEIEFRNGEPTGWHVNLMSEEQSNIYQQEEFLFAKTLLGRMHPMLPEIKIDQFQCKCLKSSLELTKTIVKIDKIGSRTIHKDKSSEKLAMHLRPMFSTNFSDAFKYLVFRRSFVDLIGADNRYHGMEPSIH